jgi:hypothetical protein
VPTLIYTTAAPPAVFVLEDQPAVDRDLERARQNGEEDVAFTGEGGKEVRVEVASVRWTSER